MGEFLQKKNYSGFYGAISEGFFDRFFGYICARISGENPEYRKKRIISTAKKNSGDISIGMPMEFPWEYF